MWRGLWSCRTLLLSPCFRRWRLLPVVAALCVDHLQPFAIPSTSADLSQAGAPRFRRASRLISRPTVCPNRVRVEGVCLPLSLPASMVIPGFGGTATCQWVFCLPVLLASVLIRVPLSSLLNRQPQAHSDVAHAASGPAQVWTSSLAYRYLLVVLRLGSSFKPKFHAPSSWHLRLPI